MIRPTRVTAMSVFPVTLTEAKAHCRVDGSDDDTVISELIKGATDLVGEMTGLVLGDEVWQFGFRVTSGDVMFPKVPVQSIDQVNYIDPDGSTLSDSVANYDLFPDPERPWMRPKLGQSWPATSVREDAITVQFSAGVAAVPAGLKTAILILVGHWFEHREAVVTGTIATELPLAVEALVGAHRLGWVGA